MRIVLQHATSGLYVKESGGWTSKLEEAQNFGSSRRAIKFMRQQRLGDVQVLVAFVEQSVIDTVTLQVPAGPEPTRRENPGKDPTGLRPAA